MKVGGFVRLDVLLFGCFNLFHEVSVEFPKPLRYFIYKTIASLVFDNTRKRQDQFKLR